MLKRSVFRNLVASDLVKVTALNSIATIVRMITGLISVKVVASLVGPAGIALLGQLNNFAQILSSISGGGVNAGMTKYVSEFSSTEFEYARFIRTGFWIAAVLTILASLVLIFSAEFWAIHLLNDVNYSPIFVIFACTLPLYVFHMFLIAVINGFKDYRKYFIINILGSLLGLAVSVFLALRFGIYGALVAAVTFQSFVFILTVILLSKSHWFTFSHFVGKFDQSAFRKLSQFSLMALMSAITVPSAQLLVRGFIAKFDGIRIAGFWEGMNRISGMYLMIITTSLGVYFLPRLAEINSNTELRLEVFKVYKLVIPFVLVSLSVIYMLRSVVVDILFSTEFLEMKEYFLLQFVADFLKICGWVLGYVMLARAMTTKYILMELLNYVLMIGSGFVLVSRFGVKGALVSFIIVYLIYLICVLYIFRGILFFYKNDVFNNKD